MQNNISNINFKKVVIVFSVGFISAYLMPQKYFIKIMSYYHTKINDSLMVRETDNYYKLY